MNPSGWLPGITDAALAHPKEYARGSIGTTEREGYGLGRTVSCKQFSIGRRQHPEAQQRKHGRIVDSSPIFVYASRPDMM